MFIKKQKINKKFYSLLIIFILVLFVIFTITPGLKGDIEQSLRIFLNEPVLFKSKQTDKGFGNNLNKIYNALDNKISNYSKFEELKIDISFSELEKLKFDRKKALELRKLHEPQKVKIIISHNGKEYSAIARLKGDLSEHWGNAKQWSLRIKLDNKKTIFSMNEFSIQTYIERDFPYNYLITETLKKFEILVPRYRDVKINFNGENWGLMLLEEQFSDSFYAFNKIKEAPIFKMTNENDFTIKVLSEKTKITNIEDIVKWQGKLETKVFNENEILRKTNIPNKNTNDNLVSIFKNLQELVVLKNENNTTKLNNHIDYKYNARVLAITQIFGDWHSTLPFNCRYYLNPYNLKVKPILTDSVHGLINKDFFRKQNLNLFYTLGLDKEEFKKEYVQTIHDVRKNFSDLRQISKNICKKFGKNCLNSIDLNILKKNIDFLINNEKDIFDISNYQVKKISSDNFDTKHSQNLNKKKINFRIYNNGEVILDNLTSENIFIHNANYKKNKNCIEDCEKNLKNLIINETLSSTTAKDLSTKKIIISLPKYNEKFLQINYSDEKGRQYSATEKIEQFNLSPENFFKSQTNDINLNINKINNNYIFNEGVYFIEKPIIIPPENNLILNKGTVLKMSNEAYIMVQKGILKINGSKQKPVKINSINLQGKWNGIYVNSDSFDNKVSEINNLEVSNYSYFSNTKIQLTGGINFVNGNVKISNSYFKNSVSEDALNLVNSKFVIENSKFLNSNSDAIDIDFGEGEIISSEFYNILGDAIDFSGSKAFLKNIKMKNISDKGISAGEESNIDIQNLYISDSRIGIASKDSSKVKAENVKILNCGLLDFASYQKKPYFSGANLKVSSDTSCKNSLVQDGSSLYVNNKKIKEIKFNVKKLYDGSL